jgi:hypothetical protein
MVREENDIPPYPGIRFRLIPRLRRHSLSVVGYGAGIEPGAVA